MIIMYMPNVACRLKVKMVISYDFLYWQKSFLLPFVLIQKLVSTELLSHLYCLGLNVGIKNYLSMMNFEFHLPYLSMDPD